MPLSFFIYNPTLTLLCHQKEVLSLRDCGEKLTGRDHPLVQDAQSTTPLRRSPQMSCEDPQPGPLPAAAPGRVL